MSGICTSSGSGATSTSGPTATTSDPVRLVARDQVDPPLRAPVVVPAGDEVRRLKVGDEPRDHVEEPAHRVHRGAVRRAQRVGYPVERAEVQRGGVEEHQSVGHALILPRRADAVPMRSAEAYVRCVTCGVARTVVDRAAAAARRRRGGPCRCAREAERERHHVQPQLVDEARGEELVRRVGAAGDRDVAIAGRFRACAKADSTPSVTKVNVVPPSISSGLARVMREHEDRRVVRRPWSPPAAPVAAPLAAHGPEHVATHDVGLRCEDRVDLRAVVSACSNIQSWRTSSRNVSERRVLALVGPVEKPSAETARSA